MHFDCKFDTMDTILVCAYNDSVDPGESELHHLHVAKLSHVIINVTMQFLRIFFQHFINYRLVLVCAPRIINIVFCAPLV